MISPFTRLESITDEQKKELIELEAKRLAAKKEAARLEEEILTLFMKSANYHFEKWRDECREYWVYLQSQIEKKIENPDFALGFNSFDSFIKRNAGKK